MQAAVFTFVPEPCRYDMSEGIALAQADHFRHARRAGGKVEEQNIVGFPFRFVSKVFQCVRLCFDVRVEIAEPLVFADGGEVLHASNFLGCAADVVAEFGFIDRNDHFDARLFHTVNEVFFHQHVRGGDPDRADLGERHQRRPVFMAALQDDEHPVAFSDAEGKEVICRFIRYAFDVAEREKFFAAEIVAPYHGTLLRVKPRVLVYDVVGEVEVFRNVQPEVPVKVVVIPEREGVGIAIQQIHT